LWGSLFQKGKHPAERASIKKKNILSEAGVFGGGGNGSYKRKPHRVIDGGATTTETPLYQKRTNPGRIGWGGFKGVGSQTGETEKGGLEKLRLDGRKPLPMGKVVPQKLKGEKWWKISLGKKGIREGS